MREAGGGETLSQTMKLTKRCVKKHLHEEEKESTGGLCLKPRSHPTFDGNSIISSQESKFEPGA